MDVPSKLLDEILQYCKVNDIENVDMFMVRMLKQGFNIEKYGMLSPNTVTHPIGTEIQPITEVVEIKPESVQIKDKKENKKDLYGE